MNIRKTYTLEWKDYRLELGRQTKIMGVVNVTPDSFSDGGHFFQCDDAVTQGEKLAEDGAHVLDIGGESTRPYSEPVSAEEEIRRVIPVIERLEKRVSIPISIDTTKAFVAKRALDAGASIINDVGALRLDPQMADIAATHGVPIILMHMLGTPKTMQVSPEYDDLLGEITSFLGNSIQCALEQGISKAKIIVDPGIGFGKTVSHNLLLIQNLYELKELDVPILIGPSRKAFIRNILKGEGQQDVSPLSPEVESGTQAAVSVAVMQGAHIVRVHDAAATRATIQIVDAIINATNAGDDSSSMRQ
jgi:dihydropteroate synthase